MILQTTVLNVTQVPFPPEHEKKSLTRAGARDRLIRSRERTVSSWPPGCSMPRLSAPSRRDCSPDSALAARSRRGGVPSLHRCIAAVPAAALALLLLAGLAAPVQAATFVSNIGQSDNGWVGTTSEYDVSHGFTTGSSGAILTSIEIRMSTSLGTVTDVPTVTLHKDSATSAAVATLTGPSSIAHAAANYTFTAPANTALDASTTYYVVLEGGPPSGNSGLLRGRTTTSDNEDSGGQTDWSVANSYGFRTGSSTGAFTAIEQALMIRVNGTTRTATVPGAPQNLEATEGEGLVRLNWSAPANSGGAVITHYEYRYAAGTTVPDATDWTALTAGDGAGRSAGRVRVTGLTNAEAYTFEVRAVNSAGGGTAAGPVTATPAAVVCAMPSFDTRRNIWSGSLTAAAFSVTAVTINPPSSVLGFGGAVGSLDDKDFTIGQAHEIDAVGLLNTVGVRSELRISLKDGPLTSSEKAALRLHVCDAAYDFSVAGGPTPSHTYSWVNTGLDWWMLSTRTLHLSLPANTAATGVPAISGTTTVGSMLTADKGTIADADGVPTESTFTYQWIRVDGSNETDISGATSSSYTLVAADDGKEFKVKVSFTDDLGSEEERISDRFPPPPPSVSIAAVYPKATPAIAHPEFRVTISAAQTSAVTVNLSIDQDASYLSSTTQSIEIPANETSATKKFLSFYGDNTSGDLTATVVAGTGYVPAAPPANAATVEVVALENLNVLSFRFAEAAYSVDEGDSLDVVVTLRTAAGVPKPRESISVSAIITAELTGEPDMATQGALVTGAGGDYAHTSETGGGAFAPSDWSADGAVFTATRTHTIATTGDSAYEGNERFEIILTRAAGAFGSIISPGKTIVTIVDDDALKATGVAVSSTPSSGSTYGAGETISFTATFRGPVTVTGTPQLSFSLGGVTKQAAFASGSDSTELVLSYTVAAGDNDADVISWAADALSLNGGTIKFMTSVVANRVDAALTHAAKTAQSGHKVDTPPLLGLRTVDGATLELKYNETLDMNSTPAASAFTVTVGGTAVPLASSNPVTVSGTTVTLTLATALTLQDATVRVSYVVPQSNPIQDAGGTDAAAFSNQVVSNRTTDGPTLTAAEVDGTGLVLTFSDPLNTASAPGSAAFTVKTGGTPVDLASSGPVAIAGSTVTLTLATAVAASDTVTVSYAVPQTNPLRDADDLDAPAFDDRPVTNRTIAVPAAPGSFRVTAGNAQAELSWSAPFDGNSPITKYRYRYAAGTAVPSGVSWRDVPDSNNDGDRADEREVTVTGLTNETEYAFEVQALNSAGEGPAAGARATPVEDPNLPSRVIDLRAVVSGNTVELTWAAPARSGSGKIARYEVRHAPGSTVPSGTGWRSAELRRFPGAYVDGLENGRRHAFEVRAVNVYERKGPAATLTATPRAQAAQTLPTAPRGLRAEGSLYVVMAGKFSSSVTERAQVKFSWEAPSNLGNTHLVRYEYRYAARGESLSSAAWNHGPASERTLTVRNLDAGTSYTFQLRAVTGAGAGRAASVGVTTPRSKRLSLSVFTRGAAVEGENLTIGVRRSGTPNKAAEVVVEIYDSTASLPTAKVVDIPAGGREGTIEFAVPFDGERGAARDLTVTLGPGSWIPESAYRVGTPASATVRVRNRDPLLRVANATVREGPQAQLSFDVSLDRAAAETVTVDYATSDGTATAGADYTATSDTLSFAAGETAKTVSVAVLDDAHDEGTETLTLTLSNARGAAIDDATATGRIVNTDPMPAAWLARFGRTSATQVLGLLDARFGEARAPASQLTLGGRPVNLSGLRGDKQGRADPDAGPAPAHTDPAAGRTAASPLTLRGGSQGRVDPGAEPAPSDADPFDVLASRYALDDTSWGIADLNSGPAARHADPAATPDPDPGALGAGGEATLLERLAWRLLTRGGWSVDRRQFLSGSSFDLSLSALGRETDAAAIETARVRETPGHWSMWGRGALIRFAGQDRGLSLDGDVLTGLLGLDYSRGRWLAGVGLAYNDGNGAYRASDSGAVGELDSTLVSVHPYLHYALTDRLSAWGTLGYGAGGLQLRPGRDGDAGDGLKSVPRESSVPGESGESDPIETDIGMRMGALGLRGIVFADAATELALKSDLMWVRTTSSATAGLAPVDGADASRVRLLLTGRHRHVLATGAELTPNVELGLRYDDGDAETGAGVELGGGLRYADPALGLTVEATARALLAHEAGGYEEWGMGGSLQLDPGPGSAAACPCASPRAGA